MTQLNNEIDNSCKDGVNYSGHVTVTTMCNDKVLTKKHYHNNGTKNLFTFFANCLWGTPGAQADYKPCKIVLFERGDNEVVNDTYHANNWTEKYAVSLPMYFDKTPTGKGSTGPSDVIETVSINNNNYTIVTGKEVTLHFRVPYLYLKNNAKVCKMGLFPANIRYPNAYGLGDNDTNEFGSMLAYYKLTSGSGTTLAWDEIEVPDAGGNFTIVVDWTLRIQNV